MEIIKYYIYAIEGKKNCEIFKKKDTMNFDLIKDQIIIYEFIDKIDYEKFLEQIDAEFDSDYILLSKAEVEYIMDNSPGNQEFTKKHQLFE